MPLNPLTLKEGLQQGPSATVEEAAEIFAEAYREWFSEATGLLSPAPLVAAKGLMKATLLTWSSENTLGLTVLQNGIIAFWGSISASAAALFTGALSATPPPGLPGIGATILTLNLIDDSITKDQAYTALAANIHASSTGGLWVLPAGTSPIV